MTWMAYCRKSRIAIRDRRAVESTDRQRDRRAAWAEARGEAVEFYVEPEGHRSGGSTKTRPQYARMMQRIRAARPGTIAGVVV
ncbi:MAG TPA: recombinase family protein, partial [Herpetosiphonaceae bacterium]|nr:recombinase family protein [Herpetosiphonaceae bacterium]